MAGSPAARVWTGVRQPPPLQRAVFGTGALSLQPELHWKSHQIGSAWDPGGRTVCLTTGHRWRVRLGDYLQPDYSNAGRSDGPTHSRWPFIHLGGEPPPQKKTSLHWMHG